MIGRTCFRAAIAGALALSAGAIADEGPGECLDGRPQFEGDEYQAFGGGQVAMATQWRTDDNQGVLSAYDLTGAGGTIGTVWPTNVYWHPDWVRSRMGQVFGVAIDDLGNVYTSHTAVYLSDNIGSIGGAPGQIYKIDSVTGAATVFATLPNVSDPAIAAAYGINESYPGLGNICFDVNKQVLYATNFEDGRIYRIDASGACLSTFDHSTGIVADCTPEGTDADGVVPLRERVWAVQSHQGRVYYSVWAEDQGDSAGDNEIHSIACDAAGEFVPGTQKLEITMPAFQGGDFSNPVADIAFSPDGYMMTAERTMSTDPTNGRFNTGAHASRALEFICEQDTWLPSPNLWTVGIPFSAAGGCDYSYAPNPDDRVWFTGDALELNAPNNTYGIQGSDATGGDPSTSVLIDMDADIIEQDKTGLGSVEITCAGDEPCATVVVEDILCELDESGNYTVTFDLTNNSGFSVKYLLVEPDAGFNVIPGGVVTLPTELADGDTTSVTLTFNGGSPGDQLCFNLSLNTRDFIECCAIEVCIDVPDCDCAQIHDEVIECLADGSGCFTYTFDVDNLTGVDIYHSFFIPLTPLTVTFDEGGDDRVDYAPLVDNGTATVSVIICGAAPGEEVCFLFTMHTDDLDECCAIEICITAPICPECPADCNGDGFVDTQDFLWFLNLWAIGSEEADWNNDGFINTLDFITFLNVWTRGC